MRARGPGVTGATPGIDPGISAAASWLRPRMSSLRYTLLEVPLDALGGDEERVGDLAVALAAAPASSATRRSLGVSPSPLGSACAGARPPARRSSSRDAAGERGGAGTASASTSASRSVPRASTGRPARRIAAPSSIRVRACSTRAPQAASGSTAERSRVDRRLAALEQPGGAAGDADRAAARRTRSASASSSAISVARLLVPAEPLCRQPRLRAPRQDRGIGREQLVRCRPGRQERLERRRRARRAARRARPSAVCRQAAKKPTAAARRSTERQRLLGLVELVLLEQRADQAVGGGVQVHVQRAAPDVERRRGRRARHRRRARSTAAAASAAARRPRTATPIPAAGRRRTSAARAVSAAA